MLKIYRDKNNNIIEVGHHVFYKGNTYEVIVNDFTGKVTIDADCGQTSIDNCNQGDLEICELSTTKCPYDKNKYCDNCTENETLKAQLEIKEHTIDALLIDIKQLERELNELIDLQKEQQWKTLNGQK
jgi:predicted sulfurtransferase